MFLLPPSVLSRSDNDQKFMPDFPQKSESDKIRDKKYECHIFFLTQI